MAAYNGNDCYLSIDGYVVGKSSGADANIFRNCELTLNTGDEDTSAGAGIQWESHDPKLSNIGIKITIVYDTATVVTDIDSVLNSLGYGSVIPIVWGPENNTAGKPKHDQDFLITQVSGPAVNHNKTAAVFELTGMSKGAPRSNLYAGDTW